METKKSLLEKLKGHDSLYRFISLDGLLNILLTKSLTLVRPNLWDDPHEMLFIKDLVDKSIRDICNGCDSAISDYSAVEHLLKAQYMIDTLYAQSWSLVAESDALWRIYNYDGKSLRLHIRIDQIARHDKLLAAKVEYLDHVQLRSFDPEYDFYWLATTKRTAFAHEEEVRVIYSPVINEDDLYVRFLKLYKSEYLRRNNWILTSQQENALLFPSFLRNKGSTIDDEIQRYKMKAGIQSPFTSEYNATQSIEVEPSAFIESVLVSPFAPEWFCKMIELLCNEYGINYTGQSTLYKKEEADIAFG